MQARYVWHTPLEPTSGTVTHVNRSVSRAGTPRRKSGKKLNNLNFYKENLKDSQTDRILRPLFLATLTTNVIFITLSVALSLASLLFTGTTLTALPAAIAQTYLVINGASIASDGVIIGAIPLLPVTIVVAVTAVGVYRQVRERASLRQLYILLALTVGIPFLLTVTAALMLLDAAQVFSVVPPPWTAYVRVVIVHLVAFGLGLGPRLWKALLAHWGLPGFLLPAAAVALRLLATWSGIGLVFVVILLIANWQSVTSPLGAVLLLILYAPNAALAGSWILLGGDYRFGESSWSLFSVDSVPLPAHPWLTAVPGTVHPAAWLLIGLMAIATAVVLRSEPTYGLVAAVFTAVDTAVLIVISSGSVGVYGYVGPTWWLVVILTAVWPAVIGAVAMAIEKIRPQPPTVTVADTADGSNVMEENLDESSGAGIGDGNPAPSNPGSTED